MVYLNLETGACGRLNLKVLAFPIVAAAKVYN
jgi:hypothetical protein